MIERIFEFDGYVVTSRAWGQVQLGDGLTQVVGAKLRRLPATNRGHWVSVSGLDSVKGLHSSVKKIMALYVPEEQLEAA